MVWLGDTCRARNANITFFPEAALFTVSEPIIESPRFWNTIDEGEGEEEEEEEELVESGRFVW